MGKYFDKYKIYYDNLSESKVGKANSLLQTFNIHLNNIKNKFTQITGTKWEEKGKTFVANIFNQIYNNINGVNSFVSENLLVTCQKADELYLKVSQIKEWEENLEAKKSILKDYEYDISHLKGELSKEKSRTKN